MTDRRYDLRFACIPLGLAMWVGLGYAVANAQSVLDTANQDWNLDTPTAPSFCAVSTPTVPAELTFNVTASRWEIVTPGAIEFDLNAASTIIVKTDGILNVNGVDHPTPVAAIGLNTWRTGTDDLGNTISASGVLTADTSMTNNNANQWTLTGTEKSFSVAPGDAVLPPPDLVLRNNDQVILTFVAECIG